MRPQPPPYLPIVLTRSSPHRPSQLGWPTANLDPAAFESTLDNQEEGVYIGWAALEDASLPPESRKVHKAVLSIGWNPTFQNEQRTVEAYLCHDFGHDFYDAKMRLLVCGYVRPQENFFVEGVPYESAMATLVEAIAADVEFGQSQLEEPEMLAFKEDAFFAGAGADAAGDGAVVEVAQEGAPS